MSKSTKMKLKYTDLTIDHTIQRQLVPNQIKRMTGENFDPTALGRLVVSRRANGAKIVLDGQHRWHAIGLEAPDMEVDCEVFEGLTEAEEAALFLALNNQSALNTQGMFTAAVVAGLPAPTAVNEILTKYGLEVGNSAREFAAVGDAMRVATWPNGLELLDQALDILTTAWGLVRENYDVPLLTNERGNRPYRGQLVMGMCRLLHRYGDSVRRERMVASLLSLGDRGPAIIAENAQRLRSSLGKISVDQTYAHALVRAYNKGTGGGKLPEWELSTRSDEQQGMRLAMSQMLAADVVEVTEE